ncbi:MAG: DUF1804 family protein [Magnetococcales bacterium]|nr:DUF1804 family protein [Magnetococcales bacterium]
MDELNLNKGSHCKAKSGEKRDAVRQAVRMTYCENGGNLSQAARAHGLSVSTVRNWKARDREANIEWEVALTSPSEYALLARAAGCLDGSRRAVLVGALIEDYLVLHQEALEAVKKDQSSLKLVESVSRLSQALDRTLRALGKASPALSRLAVANWVLERQAEFVKGHYPDYLSMFVEVLEPFGEALLQEIGSNI